MGVKHYGGAKVKTGMIIIRQQGNKVWPGEGVFVANDFTLHAARDGEVKFIKRLGKQYVSVV